MKKERKLWEPLPTLAERMADGKSQRLKTPREVHSSMADDGMREFAYQENDNASLTAASANKWRVVSMKNGWKTIFSLQ
jgi:hypothetical protein